VMLRYEYRISDRPVGAIGPLPLAGL
jgi:hypothetical protein